ncbi:MAG: helix-turn-helix transcriptional regulator [Chloroflexota bacterium]
MTKIKNAKQLAASRAWLAEFRESLKAARRNSKGLHPRLHKAELDGIRSQIEVLKSEIQEYEDLQQKTPGEVVLASLEDLPEVMVRMRIIRGLSQEQLAAKLGITAQQVQKWEAGAYRRATYSRILQVAKALEFDIRTVHLADRA